jgi:predicted transcriptional regulator
MSSDDSSNYVISELRSIDNSVKELSEKISSVDKTLAEHQVSFENHIKQDTMMYDELKRMNDILQSNTDSLKQHMYRTELLETAVLKLDQRLTPLEIQDIEKKAIKNWWAGAGMLIAKIASAIAGLAGLIYTILSIWKM